MRDEVTSPPVETEDLETTFSAGGVELSPERSLGSPKSEHEFVPFLG